mgnify:CR=1 FL=1
MNYRKFGNTGEKISALGFGCMRFPEYEKDGKMYVDQDKVDEMVAEAYRQGVNYFDTAPKYCNCNSEEAVGRGTVEPSENAEELYGLTKKRYAMLYPALKEAFHTRA